MRVDRVSASLNDDGEQQIIMVVLAFPPVLTNNRIYPKSSNTGIHIFQNVVHKFLVVLIRGNCFKIVIYFYFFKRAGEARACPPPPQKRRCHLTVKIWLFSVKRSKPGGISPWQSRCYWADHFSSSPDVCDILRKNLMLTTKRNWRSNSTTIIYLY